MIAILMCTYNGEKYIQEQIDSILSQTCKDYILYISDDGSTDTTVEITKKYAETYPDKVKLIHLNQLHNGACMHFLKAMQEPIIMEADYVMFSDQDDIWHPDKVEVTLKAMQDLEQEKYDAGNGVKTDIPLLVHCDARLMDNNKTIYSPSFTEYANLNQSKATFSHLLVQNTVTGAAMMMNKALTQKLTRIPEKSMMHDHWIALVAATFGEIKFIDKQLYDYRQHIENVLGANKGGLYEEVIGFWGGRAEKKRKRKEVREQVRQNYANMIYQAQELNRIYGDALPKDKQNILHSFISIPQKNAIARVYTILRHNITCDNWYRVIGQCSFFLQSRIIKE
ncbi:glycosyltransferase family 2 protein [Butyrivibrio sp. JL13D10]|uniref:glycosyltransferase family 2 protein n=1 Tax=Butyrivibrio sp. JL13D10 TaxID=3236815 RepID=UPI0038B635CB